MPRITYRKLPYKNRRSLYPSKSELSARAGTEMKVDRGVNKPYLGGNLFSEGGTDEGMGFEAS